MSNLKPAIIAIGYNRPDALSRLLTSLSRADYPTENIPLIISIDRSDNQADVVAAAEAFDWTHGTKIIRRFDERQGLRKHVLQCGDLSETYGTVIILEDDLIVSPDYYRYVSSALHFYEDQPCIAGISLYSHAWNGYADYAFIAERNGYDTYLGQFSITWGQCWTAAQWKSFRAWYLINTGKIDRLNNRIPDDISRWPETSWGKYFACYLVENNLFYVVPYVSLSTNCEEMGQHANGNSDAHQVPLLASGIVDYRFAPIEAAIRYDLFFERMNLDIHLNSGILPEDLCIDLNATKRSTFGKRYLLTTQRYDLPVVRSYGLRLRPIEANVIFGLPGDVIRLYDAKDGLPTPIKPDEFRRLQYELYRFDWRRLLRFTLRTIRVKVRQRISRLFRKDA
ncbi:MAG: hypothetical protein RRZ24_01065 [Clostridia bacterium]